MVSFQIPGGFRILEADLDYLVIVVVLPFCGRAGCPNTRESSCHVHDKLCLPFGTHAGLCTCQPDGRKKQHAVVLHGEICLLDSPTKLST